MQQATRRWMILVGGTLMASGGALVAACSSDSTSSPLPTADSGASSSGTSGTTSSGGTDGGGSSSGDAGADADCSKAPKLPDTSKGVYCPFQAKLSDGGYPPAYCTNSQLCCDPGIPTGSDAGFPPAYCTNDPSKGTSDTREATCQAAAAANNSQWELNNKFNYMWECADKTNCGAGQVCCATTGPDTDGGVANVGANQDTAQIPAACGALQVFKSNGTRCATSCTAGSEFKLCSDADNDCPAGTKCTPFAGDANKKISTVNLGYCRP